MSHSQDHSFARESSESSGLEAKQLEARVRISTTLLKAVRFLASPAFPDTKVNLLCQVAENALSNCEIIVTLHPDSELFKETIVYVNLVETLERTWPALVVSPDFTQQFTARGVNGYHQLYQMFTHAVLLLKGLDPREHQDDEILRAESGRFYRAYFAACPHETPTALDREIMTF